MHTTGVIAPSKRPQTTCTVEVYPHGTITDRGSIESRKPKSKFKTSRKGGGRRAKITTFSRNSAKRLRRLLAQVVCTKKWPCFGMTLTVPGPNITPEEWRRLWIAYCRKLRRLGNVALIWRIELQTRGQPHIHCICWCEDGPHDPRKAWFENLGLLGPYEGPAVNVKGNAKLTQKESGETEQEIIRVGHRAFWKGAIEHAVRIDEIGNESNIGWWRYLAAHASKSKRSQLGWKGRQWGVINAKHLDLAEPVLIELTRRAEVKVMRCLKRLIRCKFASPHGKQTWFIRTSTAMRLGAWATQACGV
jgi:hypothetical protein